MIPIGNALFNNWDEALAHARELHGRGAISTPEFIDFGLRTYSIESEVFCATTAAGRAPHTEGK